MALKPVVIIIKLSLTAMVVILYIHYFIPQSWGFFTLESKQPLYNIYTVHNGVADKKPFLKNNFGYGMGISMKGKIIYSELYNIINKNLVWKPLIEDSINYITQHGNYIILSTVSEYAALRGNFLITKADRPSYIMIKSGRKLHLQKQYVLVDIR